MDLTDDDIREFATAWQDAFQQTLTPGEARTEAVRLLAFYALLVEGPATPDASPPRPSTNSQP